MVRIVNFYNFLQLQFVAFLLVTTCLMWCNELEQSKVMCLTLGCIPLSMQLVHITCLCVTKQYNWVLAKRR